MAPAIWKLRSSIGAGWLRELYLGSPIVTGDHREAQQFPTRVAAELVLAQLPADRVPMVVVPAAPHVVIEHGAP